MRRWGFDGRVAWPRALGGHASGRNVRDERALGAMIEYLPANPVRRGLVREPGEWRWSSAAWYDGRRDVPLRIDDTIL